MASVLEEVLLHNNSLSSVPEFSANMTELQSLNLNRNQIEEIADDAFRNASALKQLRIEGNSICELKRYVFVFLTVFSVW